MNRNDNRPPRKPPAGRPIRPAAQQARPVPRGAPMRQAENPRLTALNILQDVTRSDAYASLALSKRLRESKLARRDKDLVSEIVYGTLERRIALDYLLDKRLERPDTESVVRDILRMGAYQILYLDRVPDSAAVDESVKIARLVDRAPFAGLINGVLRGLTRDKEGGALPWPRREDDLALYISVTHSLPLWIVERLAAAYGAETAEAIAAYRPDERHVTVRRTPDRMDREAFEAMMTAKGWTWRPARLKDAYYVGGIGDVGIDKEYLRGVFSVQGEGSMLAAMAVAPKRAAAVLDACAAPGGKTALLAQAMGGTGRVYAWDIHEHRVELIRGMVRRLRLDNVRPAVRDAAQPKEDMERTMDAVLLDAPCSGFGVMLQKPDVKYRKTPEDVVALAAVQKELLDAVSRYVKPGGALVYATCTILPEENMEQIAAFLARRPEFELDEDGLLAALPEWARPLACGGMLQLLPHRDGMEGFFIARLRRKRA